MILAACIVHMPPNCSPVSVVPVFLFKASVHCIKYGCRYLELTLYSIILNILPQSFVSRRSFNEFGDSIPQEYGSSHDNAGKRTLGSFH